MTFIITSSKWSDFSFMHDSFFQLVNQMEITFILSRKFTSLNFLLKNYSLFWSVQFHKLFIPYIITTSVLLEVSCTIHKLVKKCVNYYNPIEISSLQEFIFIFMISQKETMISLISFDSNYLFQKRILWNWTQDDEYYFFFQMNIILTVSHL
jgi:hypothetical protein